MKYIKKFENNNVDYVVYAIDEHGYISISVDGIVGADKNDTHFRGENFIKTRNYIIKKYNKSDAQKVIDDYNEVHQGDYAFYMIPADEIETLIDSKKYNL